MLLRDTNQVKYMAILDANVLYPVLLRDLLMRLAVTDIFAARWSNSRKITSNGNAFALLLFRQIN